MAKKTVPFNQKGIEKLPDDKPVVYKILTDGDKNNYTGVAQRGRVQDRLKEHLPGGNDYIPGSKVQIEQMSNIKDAEAKESRIISRTKPPHNEKGK
jgi:predicted GIY-YIG superfamily endonuclease